MLDGPLLSAEQFLEARFDMPESGQWAELEAGKVQLLQPPDLDHGTTLLNLSKALASYIEQNGPGYACFDLGMLMETDPDTMRFPAACYFLTGTRFAETDKPYTTQVPELVIELISTADRRVQSARRVQDYLAWGVLAVWLIDPRPQEVVTVNQSGTQRTLAVHDLLSQPELLPGFECAVHALFAEPDWWTARPKS
ncbi:MAG: Uma2 family endonuclease [Planctomycetaceae bacterium]|nr:Uma2 family endonuclease [Planctomycetaceae bacterium]